MNFKLYKTAKILFCGERKNTLGHCCFEGSRALKGTRIKNIFFGY